MTEVCSLLCALVYFLYVMKVLVCFRTLNVGRMTSSITLHKFGVLPEDPDNHVFTFIFENPHKLEEAGAKVSSIEITEGVRSSGALWSDVDSRQR